MESKAAQNQPEKGSSKPFFLTPSSSSSSSSSSVSSSNGTSKLQKLRFTPNGTGVTVAIAENGLTRRNSAVKIESNWVDQYMLVTKRMIESPFGKHFFELVDEEEHNYYKIVQNPISLKEIQKGLKTGKYASKQDVEAAYWLLFRNCSLFNPPSSAVFAAGYQLQLQYETERESNQPIPVYPHPPTSRSIQKMLQTQPGLANSLKERLMKPRATLILQILAKKDKSHVLTEEWESKTLATLKAPVRLQFIERQLKANLYGTCLAFYVDVQIMFGNIKFVYPEYSEKIRDNELLQKEFAVLWGKSEKELQQLKAEMAIPGVIIPVTEKPNQKRKSNDAGLTLSAVKKLKTSTPPSTRTSDTEESVYLEDPLPQPSTTRRQRAKTFAKRVSETRKRAGKDKDESQDFSEHAFDQYQTPRLLETRGKALKCDACVKEKRCCLFMESEKPSKCRSCKRKKLNCSTASAVYMQIQAQKSNWKGFWIVPHTGTTTQHRTPPPEKGSSPAKWSVEQVCKWLEDNQLQELKSFFQQNSITGKKLFRLEVSDLATFDEKPRNQFLSSLFRLRTD